MCYRFLPLEVAARPLRGDVAACKSPVRGSRVSGTPAAPLRIFPLTLDFRDSFISVRATARSVRAGSVHPSTRLSTQRYILSLLPPSGASASAPAKVRHVVSEQRTTLSLIGDSSPGDQRCVQPSLVSLAAGVLCEVRPLLREHRNNEPVGQAGGDRTPFKEGQVVCPVRWSGLTWHKIIFL